MEKLIYYCAEFNYNPDHQDEDNYISILKGDILEVNPANQNIDISAEKLESWVEGRNQRTGELGFFPGPYVTKCDPPVQSAPVRPVPKPRPPKGSSDSGFFGSPQSESPLVCSAFFTASKTQCQFSIEIEACPKKVRNMY